MEGYLDLDLARCRDADPALFFDSAQYPAAKAICKACPIKDDCLAQTYRLERRYGRLYGVWGGKTPRQRAQMWHAAPTGALRD